MTIKEKDNCVYIDFNNGVLLQPHDACGIDTRDFKAPTVKLNLSNVYIQGVNRYRFWDSIRIAFEVFKLLTRPGEPQTYFNRLNDIFRKYKAKW